MRFIALIFIFYSFRVLPDTLVEINHAIDIINNISLTRKTCPSTMTTQEVIVFRGELEYLKTDVSEINQNLEFLKLAARMSPPRPIKPVMLQQYEQKKQDILDEIKARQTCVFHFELLEFFFLKTQSRIGKNFFM